jgi:hypothetical protein
MVLSFELKFPTSRDWVVAGGEMVQRKFRIFALPWILPAIQAASA